MEKRMKGMGWRGVCKSKRNAASARLDSVSLSQTKAVASLDTIKSNEERNEQENENKLGERETLLLC